MAFQLGILNARIVTAEGTRPGNVYCSDGKISALRSVSDSSPCDTVVDAKENLLFPGLIDPHTHLGPFNGFESDVETETRGAIGGGITTILHFIAEKGSLAAQAPRLMGLVRRRAYADVGFIGVVMNQGHIDEIDRCIAEGVTAFKHYMSKPEFEKMLGWTYPDEGQILDSFGKIGRAGGMAIVHPENFEIIARKIEEVKAAGHQGLHAWNEARPWYCEYDHMMTAILLASVTKVPLYFVHVSIGSYGGAVEYARQLGVRLYLETNPAYLHFTDDSEIGILGKVNPPIRGKEDSESLWEGIASGKIQCVGSDHIACNRSARLGNGDIWSAIPGLHGLELTLPILLSEGYHRRGVPLQRIQEVASENPARIYRIPSKGRIEVGYDADFCLVNINREVKVTQSILHDGSDYSLYEGKLFKGWPTLTVSRGEVVVSDGQVLARRGRGLGLKCARGRTTP
jgi:dihydropyrimidinase